VSHQFDLEPEFLELHELCREQTMTSIERMYALHRKGPRVEEPHAVGG